MALDAGSLNRKISISRYNGVTEDDYGNPIPNWEVLGDIWAKVEYVSDGEKFRASQINAVISVRFTIRWGLDIRPTDKITYEGKEYDIHGVKEIGYHEGQEISAASDADYAPTS